MPPQAIASPIPTTHATPKQAANDARAASRSRTTDGRRADDAPAQRNDRASAQGERSSFDRALDRARKADEPAAAPLDAGERGETAPAPTDRVSEAPSQDGGEQPGKAEGAAETPDAPGNAPGDAETVEAGVATDETAPGESVRAVQRAETAVGSTGTVEVRREADRSAIEPSAERPTTRGDDSAKPSKPDQPTPIPVGATKISAPTNQATGIDGAADDADGARIPVSTRGTVVVDDPETSSETANTAEKSGPDRAERAERAVRLSERIATETEESDAPPRERTLNPDRVVRSASGQAFGDAEPVEGAPNVDRRPVPESQPVRVEIPVTSRERPTADAAQQPISEGESATPGAVQAMNAGARMSSEDDAARDRPDRSPGKPVGVERLDAVGKASDSGTTNTSTNATGSAQEPRGVSETRASSANMAQAKPEAPAQEQATVMAANRGLDVALKQQGGSVQMRLSPESMGALKVEMTISRGVVAATLQASTPEARDLLTRNIETLRSSLEAKGLSVERLSITLAPASQGGSSGQSFTTNSGPQGQHQPAQGGGTQNSADHDAGGERSKGFFEHHERQRHGRQGPSDHETDERLFKYRMGLHEIA